MGEPNGHSHGSPGRLTMTESEFKEFLDKAVEWTSHLNRTNQRRVIINIAHHMTIIIRCEIGPEANLANIQMANEYLHQLLGWQQHQESESSVRYEASSAVAHAWHGYQRAKDMTPPPILEPFAEAIAYELSRFK